MWWWWLLQQSLQFYRLRLSTIWVLIALSILWVGSIISFPNIYKWIYWLSWSNPLTTQSSSIYIIYIFIISLVISYIIFYRANIQVFKQQLIMIMAITVISIALPALGLYSLYYILLAASIEEYIKYYLWYWSFSLYWVTGSDLILFGLMSGLGFACIENIVYLYTMSESVMVISNIARRVVGPIVHMVYSGGIAYWYRYLRRKGWWLSWLVGCMIVMIALHTLYNAWLVHSSLVIILLVVLWWYMFISWMLYQCDRLYFTSKNNLKTTW